MRAVSARLGLQFLELRPKEADLEASLSGLPVTVEGIKVGLAAGANAAITVRVDHDANLVPTRVQVAASASGRVRADAAFAAGIQGGAAVGTEAWFGFTNAGGRYVQACAVATLAVDGYVLPKAGALLSAGAGAGKTVALTFDFADFYTRAEAIGGALLELSHNVVMGYAGRGGGAASRSGLHPTEESAIIDSMAQLIVRNLEDDIRDKLRAMADAHGRSMEEEIREILREAALRAHLDAGFGLGTRLAQRFRGSGLDAEIEELRGQPARPADLKP